MPLLPFDLSRSTGALAIGLGVVALVGAWLARPFWRWLFGPVFFYEIARVSRSGRLMWLRAGFSLLVLAAIAVYIPQASHLEPNRMHDFAARFSTAFMHLQALVLWLLAPVYFGSAIAAERESRNLDFMLASSLTSREIVLGKLAAQGVTVGEVLLAGLPVLAITQVWGGVDLLHIATGYAAILITLLSLGAFSLMCSALASRTQSAVASAYGLSLLFAVGCACQPLYFISSPFAFLVHIQTQIGRYSDDAAGILSELRDSAAIYALFHLLLAVVCVGVAVSRLRPSLSRQLYPLTSTTPREPQEAAPIDLPFPVMPLGNLTRGKLPPVGENPVYWRERNVGVSGEANFVLDLLWFYFYLIVAGAGVAGLLTLDSVAQQQIREGLGYLFRVIVIVVSMLLVGAIGLRACSAISQEREQRTLETLLSLPISRASMLWSKIGGAILRRRRTLIGLGIVTVTAVATGAVPAEASVLLVVIVAVHCLFAALLGAFLSIGCANTLRARLAWLASAITLNLGSLLSYFRSPDDSGNRDNYESLMSVIGMGGNLPMAVWHMPTSGLDFFSVLIGLTTYAVAAAGLWFLSLGYLRRLEVRA